MRQSQCSGGCFFGNLAQETADGNETIRQKVAQHLHAWTTELAAFFERWRQSGYFREDFQPQVAAQAILSLLEGALLFCKASKSPEPVAKTKAPRPRKSARQVETRRFRSSRSPVVWNRATNWTTHAAIPKRPSFIVRTHGSPWKHWRSCRPTSILRSFSKRSKVLYLKLYWRRSLATLRQRLHL